MSVVIAYRDHDLVAAVLAQLAAQTRPPRSVVVADNGGTLTEADLADMPLADRAVLVPLPDNPGYGAAVNSARAETGDGEPLLVLTHDARFGEGLADRLLEELSSDERVGAAAPLLRVSSRPDRVFSAGGRLSGGGRATHLRKPLSASAYAVDWVDGAIVMYSRPALDDIGWLSEAYFLYFEDVDTSWRLRRAGWRTMLVPDAVAYQEPGGHPTYLGIRNMTLFARAIGIPPVRHLGAVAFRVAEESAAAILRGSWPPLASAWRGWRDGSAGCSGKPGAPG